MFIKLEPTAQQDAKYTCSIMHTDLCMQTRDRGTEEERGKDKSSVSRVRVRDVAMNIVR
jgi:hypothetical protein